MTMAKTHLCLVQKWLQGTTNSQEDLWPEIGALVCLQPGKWLQDIQPQGLVSLPCLTVPQLHQC